MKILLFALGLLVVGFTAEQAIPPVPQLQAVPTEATQTLVFDADCSVTLYPGGYCSDTFELPGYVACEGPCSANFWAGWTDNCGNASFVVEVYHEGTLIHSFDTVGSSSGSDSQTFSGDEGDLFELVVYSIHLVGQGNDPNTCGTINASIGI